MCQIIDRNPNLVKTLDHMSKPYKNHIVIKHWGFQNEAPDGIHYVYVPVDWMNLEPNI